MLPAACPTEEDISEFTGKYSTPLHQDHEKLQILLPLVFTEVIETSDHCDKLQSKHEFNFLRRTGFQCMQNIFRFLQDHIGFSIA